MEIPKTKPEHLEMLAAMRLLKRWNSWLTFANHVTIDENGCWIWNGVKNGKKKNYGMFYLRPKQQLAHRAAYRKFVGDFDPELEIDHLCRVTLCVNPSHLEPVTYLENLRRYYAASPTKDIPRPERLKEFCKRGHPLADANVRPWGDRFGVQRNCRLCHKERSLAFYYKNKKRA